MPELPEMENYRRLLHERLAGQRITSVSVEREKTINLPVASFVARLQGNSFVATGRRGKHLLFHLQSGDVLLLHLMLGGFLYWGTEADKLDRTAQVTLSMGNHRLYFHGLRLGYLHLLTREEAEERLADLGPEPLDPLFTSDQFSRLLQKKRGVLKSALVDQHLLAGIGNCYADEICHRAEILPLRRIPSLSPEEAGKLFHSMQTVLREALQHGGYMEVPLFHEDHLTGGYNDRCLVYDRGNEPCPRCGHPITQDEWSSRKVFYCPSCQR
ncbi:endonuclease VIII [Brevibacillus ruminantium]|uniref:Formamidopyrimidine-DNA glycosylase n=1 Tax=Brevibacillus ruminantium TaxID=2950604 RepID=A0ABY4WEA0_9BACL|nr:DNA-formamidopyrimidine glycosylase family protein [Brevibacillus ruminantium]USG65496.1 endonuclease VIII [Brevibacillus ruminantium]